MSESTSRISLRRTTARYLRRASTARSVRARRALPIERLIGAVLEQRGIVREVRERSIAMAWRQIVDERVAKNTIPGELSREGVLTVWVSHPVWTQELRYASAEIVEQLNRWLDAREWLRAKPNVASLRVVLGTPPNPIAPRDAADQPAMRYRRRPSPANALPPAPTDTEREAIAKETRAVEDDDLRAVIEQIRVAWNR